MSIEPTLSTATATEVAPADDGPAVDGSLSPAPSFAPLRVVRHVEHAVLIAALLAAMALPLADTLGRPFGFAVPAGADILQQLVLWLAFLGGLLAARERRHLTLSTSELFPERIHKRATCSRPRCRRRRSPS